MWKRAAILVLLRAVRATGTRMDRRHNLSDVLPVIHMAKNINRHRDRAWGFAAIETRRTFACRGAGVAAE